MTSLHDMMRTIRESLRAAIEARTTRRRTERPVRAARTVRLQRTHPDDEPIAVRLREYHQRFNTERFNGELGSIAVRVSRRMRSRLGHYAPAQRGAPPEIAISKSHVRKHGFEEALHTLLHEMVHQWQDEAKLPLGHGADFRKKAREVGIVARAARAVD